ncbi:hypothetical protein F993_02846 [Acinetobacter proteolyticus]|jgi:hypothetical protein|uniref:Uncharacterized protein n=1 Tax=Acinetobacter proteolyticus TaxID=1776741 RepID=A0ABN0JB17_9GAMM|nr:hypothetical protein F993_02846 [Acinetobacter proteolyticus]
MNTRFMTSLGVKRRSDFEHFAHHIKKSTE